MREPNTRVELKRNDFELSEQVSGEAKSTKIFFIDFPRFFKKETGHIDSDGRISVAQVPVIGNIMYDNTANLALYNLMRNNPGYDVVFYPQYEVKTLKPVLGIGFILKITTVKTTARLGKIAD